MRPGSAARDRSHPGQENIQFEWLGEIIVRAAVQALHDVRPGVPGRDDNHRRVQPGGAHLLQHRYSIQAGQHDIQQDDVEFGGQGKLERAISIVGQYNRVSLGFQGAAQEVGGIRSVFCDEDTDVLILRRSG